MTVMRMLMLCPRGEAKSAMKNEYEGDTDIERIREYNDQAIGSDRLETFLMPLYDGLGIARLLD